MKKALLLSTVFLTVTTAHADNWYAGLSAGQSFASNRGTLGVNNGLRTVTEKKTFSGKQFFTGSLFFGRSIAFKDQGNILVDFAYQYNNEKAGATSITALADSKVTIQRPLTFVLNVGFEKTIKSDMAVFVKLGAAISQFDTKLEDTAVGQIYSGTESKRAFGFIPTLGIQKDIAGMTLGLSYSYAMYQEFTARKVNLAGGAEYSNKVAPRYHVVEARISKKF